MQLRFEKFDGRGMNFVEVIDKDTGQEIGFIESDGVGPDKAGGIHICLFDGKYQAWVNRFDECAGFVLGVETVLSHIIHVPKPKTQQSAA